MKTQGDPEAASSAERYIDDFVSRGALTETLLLRFIADERPMEFLVGFARMTEIDVATAKRVLGRQDRHRALGRLPRQRHHARNLQRHRHVADVRYPIRA